MKNPFTFKNDYFYGLFFVGLLALLFFLPVALGFQSLFEAFPVLYERHNLVPPQIKTPWVIDGSTHVRTEVPATRFAIETLKSGRLPLWSPYDGGGESALLLGGALYNPFRLAYFYIFDTLRAFDWAIILRFIIAGFGAFLYLRTMGLERRSALFGGVAYMFSGYFFVFLTYWFLDIEATLPYIFFGLEKYLQGGTGRGRYVFLTGLFVGLLTVAGQPQSVILATLFFGAYFLWRVFNERTLRARYAAHIRSFVFIMLIGGLIALPYFIDLLTLFVQAVTIYDYGPFVTMKHGLEYANPIYLLHLFVTPSTFLEFAIGGHLFDTFLNIVPYVTIAVLLLFLLSFFMRPKPNVIYFFYGFVAFGILKIFGFPLVHWIGSLPILDKIGWHKLYGPMAFAVSVVAAFAFDGLSRRLRFDTRRFLASILSIIAAFLFIFLAFRGEFLQSYTPDLDLLNRRPETVGLIENALARFPEWIRSAALSFIRDGAYFVSFLFLKTVLFASVVVALIFWAVRSKKTFALTALLIFLVFESWLYMPKIRDGFKYFDPYVTPPFVEFLQSKTSSDYFGVISTGYTFPVSLGDTYRIRKFQTTSAVFPERFRSFVPDTILKNDHDYFKLNTEDVAATPQKFFDAANLKYFVTESTMPFEAVDSAFKLVYDDDLRIYENTVVLPRAYLVFHVMDARTPAEARDMFYAESFDPKTSVVLEGGGEAELLGSGKERYVAADIVSYRPDEVVISTEADRDAMLVLTDTFFSRWRAYLDDRPTAVYPANVLFRGVYVPKGTHEVRFAYEPLFFPYSIIVSLLTMAIVPVIFVWHRRTKESYETRTTNTA
ncbi:MAG: hypothetical protein HY435_02995 [Candidatus Liptonbacteria bacterium]|nr:hypothetical protein [Candidatus Liptonbacteria bacterium]